MPNWELVHTPGKMPQTPLFKILGVQNSSIGDLEIVTLLRIPIKMTSEMKVVPQILSIKYLA